MNNEFEMLAEMDAPWADVLMQILRGNEIPCTARPLRGAGLVTLTGGQERYQIFVSPERLDQAKALLEDLDPAAVEEEAPLSGNQNRQESGAADAYTAQLHAAADFIRERVGEAEIGVILGSGLGDYVDALEDARHIDYAEIPGFPRSTAPGHAGRWWVGKLHGKRVCMMQGRFHAYEGWDLKEVTMPVRVMSLLGVKTLLVTNAAGGVNTNFNQGCLMILTDFINMSGKNPLTGPNLSEFGPRFPDMSHAYDAELIQLCERTAARLDIPVEKGVYMWMNGPTYETPAEVRMARILGADAVGMSTVPETIVARHCGMRVLGVSCITNMAAGILDQVLDEQEVIDTAARVKNTFRRLLDETIRGM